MTDDPLNSPLTEKEEAFLTLLQSPSRYRQWAERTLARWEQTPEGKAAVTKCYRTIGGFRTGPEWTRRRAG